MLDSSEPIDRVDTFRFKYKLKGTTITERFNRYAYITISKFMSNEGFSEKEDFEVFLLRDSLYGVRDITWIIKNNYRMKALDLAYQAITKRLSESFIKPPERWLVKHQLSQEGLLGCNWFGNSCKKGVTSLLRKYPKVEYRTKVPKRYIGVGYRDKGSKKMPHLDGTPCWQEVYIKRFRNEDEELQDWQKERFVKVYGKYYNQPWFL
jgi:hypothetical protein